MGQSLRHSAFIASSSLLVFHCSLITFTTSSVIYVVKMKSCTGLGFVALVVLAAVADAASVKYDKYDDKYDDKYEDYGKGGDKYDDKYGKEYNYEHKYDKYGKEYDYEPKYGKEY